MAATLRRQRARGSQAQPFQGVEWGPVAWKGLPTPLPPNQIGVYGDWQLSQYPANIPGPQLFGGVQALRSGWVVDSRSLLPIWQQTQNPANVAGGQRGGSIFSAGHGPIALLQERMAMLQRQAAATGAPAGTAAAIIHAANNLPGG